MELSQAPTSIIRYSPIQKIPGGEVLFRSNPDRIIYLIDYILISLSS